jgi:hypothetical protein
VQTATALDNKAEEVEDDDERTAAELRDCQAIIQAQNQRAGRLGVKVRLARGEYVLEGSGSERGSDGERFHR